jgi:hypothetical protein
MTRRIMSPEQEFRFKMNLAASEWSPGKSKIIKPEWEDALGALKRDGSLSQPDLLLISQEVEGKDLSKSVQRAYKKLVKGIDPDHTPVSAATKKLVKERFEDERSDLGEPMRRLPVGPRFESFVLEDSTCPPGAMCIWAGQKTSAYLPAGTHNAPGNPNDATEFYVGVSGPPPTAPSFYGPFPMKVTHHTPHVTEARYYMGMGVRPIDPDQHRGPAVIVTASLFPIDCKPKFSVSEEGNVITVVADSTRPEGKPVPRGARGIMRPREFELPYRPNGQPGTEYTLRVVDRDGNALIPDSSFVYHIPA